MHKHWLKLDKINSWVRRESSLTDVDPSITIIFFATKQRCAVSYTLEFMPSRSGVFLKGKKNIPLSTLSVICIILYYDFSQDAILDLQLDLRMWFATAQSVANVSYKATHSEERRPTQIVSTQFGNATKWVIGVLFPFPAVAHQQFQSSC